MAVSALGYPIIIDVAIIISIIRIISIMSIIIVLIGLNRIG